MTEYHYDASRDERRIEELEAKVERYERALEITPDEVGRIMHESWMRTKTAQGFHVPPPREAPCRHCHADLIPWEQLPEAQKDINRHAFDDVLAELKSRAGDALREAEEVRE